MGEERGGGSTYRVAGSEAADETLGHVGKVRLGWLAWEQGRGQGWDFPYDLS